MKVARTGAAALLATLVLLDGAGARDAGRAPSAVLADTVEGCVDHSAIRFGANELRTLLDPVDAAVVAAALVRRYPVVGQAGLQPQQLALWRKPGAGWIYIALLANPAKPNEVCHTATFVADTFGFTPRLVAKYFDGRSPLRGS
jgi:hypothetical protein